MQCRTGVTVSAVELLTMTTVSVDSAAAGGRLSCDLAAGHQGSHIAFAGAARDGEQWWWLRWDGGSGEPAELVQIDPCPAELPQGRYADDCLLPEGHPGPHSFDVPTVRRRPGTAIASAEGSGPSGGRPAGTSADGS
jgi:hypothetical protein